MMINSTIFEHKKKGIETNPKKKIFNSRIKTIAKSINLQYESSRNNNNNNK